MNKIYLAVLLFFCFTFPHKVFAIEDNIQINLQEAINIAVEKNIDLEAAKINIDIAKNKIKSSNRLQNPDVGFFYNLGAAGHSEPHQLGIREVIELGKRHSRKDFAKLTKELEDENFKYKKFQLKMDVREAYINLIAEKSILDTLEQQKDLQEELNNIVKKRVTNKKAPEIDALQSEIALNQMITQVNSAKVSVRNALIYFNKVINPKEPVSYETKDKIFLEENNFEELLTPDPALEIPPFEEIKERALKNRYDIKIAKKKVDIARKNISIVTNQRIPDVEVSGGYQFLRAGQSDTGDYKSGAYIGANLVNLPFFYTYKPEIENARLEYEQAEMNYISTINKAIKDVDAAYAKFVIARTNLNYYEKKILVSSDELIKTSIKNYNSGNTDLTSLIVMKQSYKSIIIGYAHALAEYYNSWTFFLREVNDESFDLYKEHDINL